MAEKIHVPNTEAPVLKILELWASLRRLAHLPGDYGGIRDRPTAMSILQIRTSLKSLLVKLIFLFIKIYQKEMIYFENYFRKGLNNH